MSADPIERLRGADPVPDGGSAPPLEEMLERVRADRHGSRSRHRPAARRRRRGPQLMPAFGVAVTLAVITVVIVATIHHHAATAPTAGPAGRTPTPTVRTPRRFVLPAHAGMKGLILGVAVVGSGDELRIGFTQCAACGDSTADDNAQTTWVATTSDAGASWFTSHAWSPAQPTTVPDGENLWELRRASASASFNRFFVSHDGGRSFTTAHSEVRAGGATVSVADGTAWTVGSRCMALRCPGTVLHGPAAGDRLTRTVAQPRSGAEESVAGAGPSAYVTEQDPLRMYATADDGRSWRRVAYPCPAGRSADDVSAAGGATVMAACLPEIGPHRLTAAQSRHELDDTPSVVRRSTDGGRTWTTLGLTLRGLTPQVDAFSPSVAWATTAGGVLRRTTDGGSDWTIVLSGVGRAPAVDIESATAATVVSTVTDGTAAAHDRRSDFVVYRTSDGGAHWAQTVVPLPHG